MVRDRAGSTPKTIMDANILSSVPTSTKNTAMAAVGTTLARNESPGTSSPSSTPRAPMWTPMSTAPSTEMPSPTNRRVAVALASTSSQRSPERSSTEHMVTTPSQSWPQPGMVVSVGFLTCWAWDSQE